MSKQHFDVDDDVLNNEYANTNIYLTLPQLNRLLKRSCSWPQLKQKENVFYVNRIFEIISIRKVISESSLEFTTSWNVRLQDTRNSMNIWRSIPLGAIHFYLTEWWYQGCSNLLAFSASIVSVKSFREFRKY